MTHFSNHSRADLFSMGRMNKMRFRALDKMWLVLSVALIVFIVYRYFQQLPGLINGVKAPEFSFYNLENKEVKLSDLHGKYVFLDFWGSWCGPCRKANKKWGLLYRELKDTSLYRSGEIEFVSIATESNREAWQNAIEQDKLSWKNHFMEARGSGGGITQLYEIKAFPSNYLIDEKGIIIGVNVGPRFIKKRLAKQDEK